MDFFKDLHKKTLDEAFQIPTTEQSLEELRQRLKSGKPLRKLGSSQEAGNLKLSEQDRQSHIHILGTTREGKSKFLEMLLTQDMGRFGATLLDPSDNGATCYSVMKWAMKKGFEKVCLIDPHDANIAIPSINPLRWRGAAACESVVQNIMESIRLLWGQTSFSDTPRIETYLKAVLAVLYMNKATLPDGVCFLVKQDGQSDRQRRKLFDNLPHYDVYRKTLEEVFNTSGQQLFLGEFKPSIRRLQPFFSYLPRMIYGSTECPIDFRKLVSEKWLILVNLDKTRLWGIAEQRVLGTLIVNEIIGAVSDLRHNSWSGQHYLYIDEAGQFATRVLADIMAYKGKSGLWAALSHQFYDQFEDKYVLNAVENLCHIKVLFFTPNAQDRARMIRDMYTGELKTKAADAHAALKKQHAVIKIGKQPPVSFRVQDINTPPFTGEQVGRWKEEKIYKPNPWYRTQKAVLEEITNRFAVQSPAPNTTGANRNKTNTNAQQPPDNAQGTTGQPHVQPSAGENPASPKRKSVFDSLPDSEAVLRDKKGRPARKSVSKRTTPR